MQINAGELRDFVSLHRKQKAPEVSPRQCVMDRPRQQTRNSFERTRTVETSGSIYDSPTAEPERPNPDRILEEYKYLITLTTPCEIFSDCL